MGMLDTLNNWQQDTDMESPNNQRMMGIAAALLQAGGPSRSPVSLGQALGGALQYGQQAYQGAQDRLTQADLRKQQKIMQDLQMKGLGIDIQGKQAAQDQADALKRGLMNFNKSRMTPKSSFQQPMQDQGMNEELAQLGAAGAPSMPMSSSLQAPAQMQAQPQAAQPAGQFSKANPIQAQISRLNEMADFMEQSEGISGEAYRKQAFDLMGKMPKVKDWQKVNVGGQVLYAPYYDDGSSGQPVPYQVAEKLHFANIGGSTVGQDQYTGKTVNQIKNTQSPDNAASTAVQMRGQNMLDSRESAKMAQSDQQFKEKQKAVLNPKMSSALQKELIEADDISQASRNVISSLQEAKNINKKAYSGFGANTRAAVMSNIYPTESADATVNLSNLTTGQALESLKIVFGGMPTEGERKILLEMQASADKTPAQREEILNRGIKLAETRGKYAAAKAKSIREGNYLTEGFKTPDSAANPIESLLDKYK